MIHSLLSIVLSPVPERYRSRIPGGVGFVSAPGAVVSGVMQMLVCLGVLIYRYIVFFNEQFRAIPSHVMLGAAEVGGDTAIKGMGLMILVAYVIQPVSIVLIYFSVEGLIRLAAAVITSEIVPTLPLQLVVLAHDRIAKAKYEHDLGPPVEDLVSPGAGDFALCIASCRPKPWTSLSTISYQETFYELAREDYAQPPRQWVYVLRKRPAGKVIRGEIYYYAPDELLPKKEEAAAEAN